MRNDYTAPFITDIKIVPASQLCQSAFESGADVMPIFSRDHPGLRMLYNDAVSPYNKAVTLVPNGSGNGRQNFATFPMTAPFPRTRQSILAGHRICAKKMSSDLQERPGFEGLINADAQGSCPSGMVACDIDVGADKTQMACLKSRDSSTSWKSTNCPITSILFKKVGKGSGCGNNQRAGFTCVEFGDERVLYYSKKGTSMPLTKFIVSEGKPCANADLVPSGST